jgi:hypothetical protein
MGYISTSSRDGITYYLPENPQSLKSKLIEKMERVDSLIPELLSITNTLAKKPKIRFYE